ncbi:hypothetical protein L1887_39138 [Cichorium endivia]|nr:hypothetical protein L1887_39138 [Cichorium endivia]
MGDNYSIALEELGNLGESEIKLKSNGVCRVEHVNDKLLDAIKIGDTIAMSPSSETLMSPEGNGSSSLAVTKRHGLRKWRRIPRELVNSPMVNVNGNSTVSNTFHGDSGLSDQPVLASRADSTTSEGQSSRSSSVASTPRTRIKISSSIGGNSAISIHSNDQQSNGQNGTTKKARGFKIDKENSDSNMRNFVFVQGTNSVASKSKQSGGSVKYDEEYSDDEHLNTDAKSEDVSHEDAAAEDPCEVNEEKIGKDDQDALVESITRFDSAVEELEREVQKWKDIGKDEPLTFDDSINDMLEFKDAMIKELESTITSEDTKTDIDFLLREKIQAEVEIVAITTATKSLITGPLNEIKFNLQQENTQTKKLETKEDVKKLLNRVCRISSCLLIQLILLFVTFYHEISSQKVDLVPT